MTQVAGWLYFGLVQIIFLVAMVIGWVLLIPFCVAQAWKPINSPLWKLREIDAWSFGPLNFVYGNPEDGVSGQKAIVWNKLGTAQVPYMPGAWAPWRAYCWSAWRNSTDNLKYVFAWNNGPFKQWTLTIFGRSIKIKAGWQEENGLKVPVLS